MTHRFRASFWGRFVAAGLSALFLAQIAQATQPYLEDADYEATRGFLGRLTHGFPRKMLSETKALPSTAEGISKYDGISVHSYQLRQSAIAQAQQINPDLLIFKSFLLGGFQGGDIDDACNNWFTPSFGATGAATSGCSYYAGHWLYYAGTTTTASLSASTLTVNVADGSRITAGSYVVIYDAPAGSFRNAEHALVRSRSGNTITFAQRGYKSTARSHSAGAIIAEHPIAGAENGVESSVHWMFNLSSVCPSDSNGNQLTDVFTSWLATNYNKTSTGQTFSGRVDGILFDTDDWDVKWRNRIDANNDLNPDGGWSSNGTNWWGVGLEQFYQQIRNRMPSSVLIVAGARQSRGIDSLNGTQMEGWPVSNAYFSPNPQYDTFDELLSDYTVHMRGGIQSQPGFSDNLSKVPTNTHPLGESPRPSNNRPFRFGLGASMLDDGYYSQQPESADPDLWWDEFAVITDTSSSNYGRAVASNPNNESQARQYGGWLGKPLGSYHRVYDDATFAPGNTLLADGSLNTSTAVNRWSSSRVNISLDTSTRLSGAGALRVSGHTTYASNLTQASVRSQSVSLQAGVDYTLAFAVRGQDERRIRVTIGNENQLLLIPSTWMRHVINFRPTSSGNYAVTFYVGEENVPLWIDEVYLFRGNTNILTREFEHGMVVVNATNSSRTVQIGQGYQRILGTQDSVNNGAVVNSLTLPAYDAAVLIRTANSQPPGGGGGGGTGPVDPCGVPQTTSGGFFLWENCGSSNTRSFVARGVGDGTTNVTTYAGTVEMLSSNSFSGVGGQDGTLEVGDVLSVANGVITYELNMQQTYYDQFGFSFPSAANVCFGLDLPPGTPVRVGASGRQVAAPFNLTDFTACSTGGGGTTVDPCGAPQFVSGGIHLWQNCATTSSRSFAVRAVGDGTTNVKTFAGAIGMQSSHSFSGVAGQDSSLESGDTLSLSGGVITYELNMQLNYYDQFGFTFPNAASVCFGLDLPPGTPVRVGSQGRQLTAPFDLTGFGACSIVGGGPDIDTLCDQPAQFANGSLYLWEDCSAGATRSFSVRATGATSNSSTTYQGSVSSITGQAFSSVGAELNSIESDDVLRTLNSARDIQFSLQVTQPWLDQFGFDFPAGADACFGLDLPAGTQVSLGASGTKISAPFSLYDLRTCTP